MRWIAKFFILIFGWPILIIFVPIGFCKTLASESMDVGEDASNVFFAWVFKKEEKEDQA